MPKNEMKSRPSGRSSRRKKPTRVKKMKKQVMLAKKKMQARKTATKRWTKISWNKTAGTLSTRNEKKKLMRVVTNKADFQKKRSLEKISSSICSGSLLNKKTRSRNFKKRCQRTQISKKCLIS